jgi:hypothetical protein
MTKFLTLVGILLTFANPAFAADRKPIVLNGAQQQAIQATDTLKLPAATTANASINITPGVAPTSPNNGDCWTTTAGLYCRINGATALLSSAFASGSGPPAPSSDPIGSLYTQTDVADLYQQVVPSTSSLGVVQAKAAVSGTVTLTSGPTGGNLLIAACTNYPGTPGVNTGWTDITSNGASVSESADRWVYKSAGSGESSSQTPCTSSAGTIVWEISGGYQFAQINEGGAYEDSFSADGSLGYTTTHANDLLLGASYKNGNSSDPGAITISGSFTQSDSQHGGLTSIAGGYTAVSSSGSSSTLTYSNVSSRSSARILALMPPAQGWQKLSRLARIQNAGSDISTSPMVLNCSTGTTCAMSASPYGVGDFITLTATGSGNGANPTGTVGLSTVNGSATTFLRSDGAPPLSQAIAPTWTGAHQWTPAVGATPIKVNNTTQTSSFPVLDLTQSWNSGGTTFTGLKFNVSSNTSAAASLLFDLQVAAASKFKVGVAGDVTASGYVKLGTTTVGSLPSAATVGAGTHSFVTDATACTFGSAVTGGGSTACPVYSDGTNWNAG